VRSRLVAGAAGTALAAVLMTAPSAGGAIVLQHGIGGVQLHMTKASVRSTLGAPRRVVRGRNDFGRYTIFVYPRVTVSFQSGPRVTGLRTSSRLERTAAGIGVGSTETQVRSRVARVHCRTDGGSRHCFVGRFLPGHVVTDFQLRGGRVSRVDVGVVLD
jgi:hypothetical protein